LTNLNQSRDAADVSESLWRHRDFLRLWAADSLSQTGTQVTVIALPLLAIKVLDASPFEVGLLTTFEFLAFLLVGLPAGAWVDRVRRRNVLLAGDLLRAALFGSLPLAWSLGVLTLPQVYAVALLAGACTVFFDVAYQSYLPHLVGRDHLVEGNSKLQGTQSVAQVAGPTLGGVLVQVLTAPYAILVDALSYLWSAAWVASIRSREPVPERQPGRRLVREVREGLSFVLGHRLLRAITATTATSNLFMNVGQTALVVLLAAPTQLNLPAGTIGLFYTAAAVGGLVGAVVARRLAALVGQGPAIWIPVLLEAPFLLPLPFVQRGWQFWLAAVCFAGVGMTIVVYNITQVSFRQLLCPERLLGRMNATIRFIVWGTIPVGGFVGGVLGSTIGLRPTLWVSVAGAALAFLPVFLSPLRRMRELPTTYGAEGAAWAMMYEPAAASRPLEGAAAAGSPAASLPAAAGSPAAEPAAPAPSPVVDVVAATPSEGADPVVPGGRGPGSDRPAPRGAGGP
jgi:MFS family permease